MVADLPLENHGMWFLDESILSRISEILTVVVERDCQRCW